MRGHSGPELELDCISILFSETIKHSMVGFGGFGFGNGWIV